MDLRPMDLSRLVEEVYGQVKVLAEAHNITLSLGHMESISIHGDRERLRRLLLNLVDNGMKYTPAGGQITLSLQKDRGWASLQIADTGLGIPNDEKEQVFQPFYRANEARKRGKEGVGLGLSIANSIAKAHEGKIDFESIPGHGTVFTVLLPSYS